MCACASLCVLCVANNAAHLIRFAVKNETGWTWRLEFSVKSVSCAGDGLALVRCFLSRVCCGLAVCRAVWCMCQPISQHYLLFSLCHVVPRRRGSNCSCTAISTRAALFPFDADGVRRQRESDNDTNVLFLEGFAQQAVHLCAFDLHSLCCAHGSAAVSVPLLSAV